MLDYPVANKVVGITFVLSKTHDDFQCFGSTVVELWPIEEFFFLLICKFKIDFGSGSLILLGNRGLGAQLWNLKKLCWQSLLNSYIENTSTHRFRQMPDKYFLKHLDLLLSLLILRQLCEPINFVDFQNHRL